MLQIVSALLGFFAPFLPQVVKLFQQKIDNAHELEMMRLRLQMAAQEHLWRMEEISASADIAEAAALHRPQQSFGVQLLDAAKGSNMSGWTTVPVFWLFALLDLISGLVRPAITYGVVAFYMAVKYAQFQAYSKLAEPGDALRATWTDNDWGVLVLVLSFWFGNRTARAVFGGKK